MSRPSYTLNRCSCEEPVLQIEHVRYQRGSGLIDFFCVTCNLFRCSKALDDMKPYNRQRLRDMWSGCDGECS